MPEFESILAVAIILWSALILYAIYLDSRVRDLAKKISNLEKMSEK